MKQWAGASIYFETVKDLEFGSSMYVFVNVNMRKKRDSDEASRYLKF